MYTVIDNYILEKDSGQKIEFDGPKRHLNTLVRKLNLGAGFQGFTPSFMCNSLSPTFINNCKDTQLTAGITCKRLSNT